MTILKNKPSQLSLVAPLSGTLLPIVDSSDKVFANKLIGDGVVIQPTDSVVLAPFSGTVSQLHESKHAVAIRTNTGIEVLIHVGIDTVMLRGEGFEAKVKVGDEVALGQTLLTFDPEFVKQKAKSLETAMIVSTGETGMAVNPGATVCSGQDIVFTLDSGADKTRVEPVASGPTDTTLIEHCVLKNPLGLHARPAATLIQIIKQFNSEVVIQNKDNGKQSNGNSLTALMGLQTLRNSNLKITVTGPDAQKAMHAILEGVHNGLGEQVSGEMQSSLDQYDMQEEAPLLQSPTGANGHIPGVTAVPGIAIGQIHHLTKELPSYQEEGVTVDDELAQLGYGIGKAEESLQALVAKLEVEPNGQSDVFVAHQRLLGDPVLIDRARDMIASGKSAMWAWHKSFQMTADEIRNLDNPVLAARATDIEDVGHLVLRYLMGVDVSTEHLAENTVLCLEDITPSEVVALNRDNVIGIVTLKGGVTSHASILAGSIGIPYLVNISDNIRQYENGSDVILNADKGYIQLNPSQDEKSETIACMKRAKAEYEEAIKFAHQPAITQDGHSIEIAANIASQNEADKAVRMGAEAIGLLRSEFLYMDRATEPSITEQVEVYKDILATMGPERPVVIRTLDIGGDKPLAYLPMPKEENPFLGERGVRICINRPSVLRRQMSAILKASHAGQVRVMLPMVSSLDELRAVKRLFQEEQEKEGVSVELGIMVEVPSAALLADHFAKEVDFFSIGTNDLTQYTLAVDRGHPTMASRANALHPAVLRLIDMTVRAANKEGKWVGICGSLASDPNAIALQLGLGVKELSVNVPVIPVVKARVRHLNYDHCQSLARDALSMDSVEEIRRLINKTVN